MDSVECLLLNRKERARMMTRNKCTPANIKTHNDQRAELNPIASRKPRAIRSTGATKMIMRRVDTAQ